MRFIPFILFLFVCFVYSAQDTLEICAGDSKTVSYFVTSTTDGINTWTVNNETFLGDDLSYTYTQSGVYNITVRRENGVCYAEQTLQVVVNECPGITFWVPNTFTPDGNEFNQYFGPVMNEGFDVDGFSFLIYNRWGETIFSSYNPNGKWNGTHNQTLCQSGTYSWVLRFNVKGDDGVIQKSGHVNLLR